MALSPDKLFKFSKSMEEKMKKTFLDLRFDEFIENSLRRFLGALEEKKKLTQDDIFLHELVRTFKMIKTYKMNSWVCLGCSYGFTEFAKWISHLLESQECCDFDSRILREHTQQCRDVLVLDSTMFLSSDLQLEFRVVKNKNGVRVNIDDFDSLMKLLCDPCYAIPKPVLDLQIKKTNWDLLCGILKRGDWNGEEQGKAEEEEQKKDPTINLLEANIVMRLDRKSIMCLLEKVAFCSYEKYFKYVLFTNLKDHLEREFLFKNTHELDDLGEVKKKKKKDKKKKKKKPNSKVEAETSDQEPGVSVQG